jgi:D-sedoheptulose 7-phosphate isomerase
VELFDVFLELHPEVFVLVVGSVDLGLKAGRFAERITPCHGLPLTTSSALVELADLFLGVDSCMLHAADLFRVPSVGLFGPGGHIEFGFRFGPHRYVFSKGSMESISAGEVLSALEVMLDPAAGDPRPADPLSRVREALLEGIELRRRLCDAEAPRIAAAAALIVASLRGGGKLLLCGNGGSAADCQHIAAELTGRFADPTRRALPALSLTTDTSALTAIANDLGYERVFERQVEALGRPGDVLLTVSTSGRSPSVIRAASRARALGLCVIALTGPAEAPLHDIAELSIRAPGRTTDRIQELHISVGHILCDLVERALAPGGRRAPPGDAEGAS